MQNSCTVSAKPLKIQKTNSPVIVKVLGAPKLEISSATPKKPISIFEQSADHDIFETFRNSLDFTQSVNDPITSSYLLKSFGTLNENSRSFYSSSKSVTNLHGNSLNSKNCTLLGRITRGRLRAAKINTQTPSGSIINNIRPRSFSTPRVVKVFPKSPVKPKCENLLFNHKKVIIQNDQKLIFVGATDKKRIKDHEVERIYRIKNFRGRVAPDLVLDNYRKKSRSPTPEFLNSEINLINKIKQKDKKIANSRNSQDSPIKVVEGKYLLENEFNRYDNANLKGKKFVKILS